MFEIQNKYYLILVDYYSNFIEVEQLKHTTSYKIINHCKSQFARHGIPDIYISDNGPQFSSSLFQQFSNEYGFQHHTSSPYHPQSNGMAEKAVQTIKNILRKVTEDKKDFYLALLDFRNTPITKDSGSPVQRVMGRGSRTLLPTTHQLLILKNTEPKIVERKIQDQKDKQKFYYVGDKVKTLKNDHWEPAIVTGVCMEPHSYVITTPQGEVYRRNRKHLSPDNFKELITQSSPHPSTSNDKEIHGNDWYDSPKNQRPQAKEDESIIANQTIGNESTIVNQTNGNDISLEKQTRCNFSCQSPGDKQKSLRRSTRAKQRPDYYSETQSELSSNIKNRKM